MNGLLDKENRCIRIGRTYALLTTLLEYKHERSESIIGLRADRKLLNVCTHLNFSSENVLRPAEKTLEALWYTYGPSRERLHGCLLDDRVDCLCLWLDVLYGEGTAARLSVRSRIKKTLHAEREVANAAPGVLICFVDPLAVLISELSAELPTYDSVINE